jgi:hypothetical protein
MTNVVNLFPPKISAIPEGQTLEESTDYFFGRLDVVMNEFNLLSVAEKYSILESLVEYGKTMTTLYMDLRSRHQFNLEWYAGLSDKLAEATAKNGEKGIE